MYNFKIIYINICISDYSISDQLRILQNNRKMLPRFGPSDDIEKLSTALKKMNSAKLPYLEDAERSESVCDNMQCSHTTHRCHHAAHTYTGIPCAAYSKYN